MGIEHLINMMQQVYASAGEEGHNRLLRVMAQCIPNGAAKVDALEEKFAEQRREQKQQQKLEQQQNEKQSRISSMASAQGLDYAVMLVDARFHDADYRENVLRKHNLIPSGAR